MKSLGWAAIIIVYLLTLATQLPHIYDVYSALERSEHNIAGLDTALGASIAFEASVAIFTLRTIVNRKAERSRWTRPGIVFFLLLSVLANTSYYFDVALVDDAFMPGALTIAIPLALWLYAEEFGAEAKAAIRQQRKVTQAPAIHKQCRVCEQEFVSKYINDDGLCKLCARRANGETHQLPFNIAIQILERDDWTCYYCGKDVKEVGEQERHLDHFIPKSKEGQDIVDNIVTSCQQCNLGKGDRLPSERERWEFAQYLQAKRAGPDKKSQILALAFSDNGDIAMKQADIARILRTSQGYVSSVVSEHERSKASE